MNRSENCSVVGIARGARFTRFKWHRARRQADDFSFSTVKILDGLALGASVEIDLVQHGSAGFAVLHNVQVEKETSGSGSVRELDDKALETLYRRAPDGTLSTEHVLTFGSLALELRAMKDSGRLSDKALLQLDLKDSTADIWEESYAVFAQSTDGIAENVILSGDDKVALRRLKGDQPALRLGFDPCYGDILKSWLENFNHSTFVERAVREMPEAKIIYIAKEIFLRALADGFSMADALHQHGIEIDVYTLGATRAQETKIAATLIEVNVNQITTDDPEGLAQALKSEPIP